MKLLLLSPIVLALSELVFGIKERHKGVVKSFKKDDRLEEKILEQIELESPYYLEYEFSDERKILVIQNLGAGGYEIKILVDSVWTNIEKATTCYVFSGSYKFSELSFVLKNPERKNKIDPFLITETLVGWTMVPSNGGIFSYVSVQVIAPPIEKEQGKDIVLPAGYCEDD